MEPLSPRCTAPGGCGTLTTKSVRQTREFVFFSEVTTMIRLLVCGSVIAAALCAGLAFGHGIVPQSVPVARLIANLTKYTEENPNDSEGYYRLARVHTL